MVARFKGTCGNGRSFKLATTRNSSSRHIAFKVENVDTKLAELGENARVTLGPLDFSDVILGWRTIWIADPEGNIIEISQGYIDEDGSLPAP